jgi:hypothetical protein
MKRLLFLALCISHGPLAQADVLHAGQTLRIEFTAPTFLNSQVNVMSLGFGPVNVLSPFTTMESALYDGSTFIGLASQSFGGTNSGPSNMSLAGAWTTPTSPYAVLTPGPLDTTTIVDGSIVGRVYFTIQTGAIDIPLNQVELKVYETMFANGGHGASFPMILQSVEIVGPPGTPFCTSGPNSTGFPANIAGSGSTSVAANDLVLVVEQVPTNQTVLFFYGPDEIQQPFGDGFRCVGGSAGSVRRLPPYVQVGPSSVASVAVDNVMHADLQQPGSTWKFQAWYRDPAAGGAGFNLSDGVSLTFLP